MTTSLFTELRELGISEELAHQVSAALDPDHIATKKDVLLLQKAILKVQASSEKRHIELKSELKSEINSVRLEMAQMKMDLNKDINGLRVELYDLIRKTNDNINAARSEFNEKLNTTQNTFNNSLNTNREEFRTGLNDLRIEMHQRHRHSIYAFGAIIVSIFTVLAVNIYFHLNVPPL